MIFKKQIAFIDDLENNIFETLRNVINSFGIEIEKSITEDQMFKKGIDGTGKKIKDQKTGRLGYTRQTIRLKISKGQPVDRVTLRDNNDFHPSIEIKAFSDRFEVSSNVTHAKFLISRYGEDIMRPTAENFKSFFEKNFLPEIKRYKNDKLTR